ncbi:MAG: hypothetical protein HRU40_16015, partial [Saprospiraceae bacterium]|nr:hypothetical protein [Saprospiraceae bacterium]
ESGNIWLVTEAQLNPNNPFEIVRKEQLWSVPYAFYAAESAELAPPETNTTRSTRSSVYWLTSGNAGNSPLTHGLGTMDNQPLVFKVNDQERMRIESNGQLKLTAGSCCTTVDDDDKSKYPFIIEGANQGIWLEIETRRDIENNFLTFEGNSKVLGAIRGETIANWEADAPYQNKVALFSIEAASFVVMIAAEIIMATGDFSFPCSAPGGAPNIAKAAQIGVDLVEYGIRVGEWQARGRRENGVRFDSGGADYSEWLAREKDLDSLGAGRVVGIREGKITLNTDSSAILRVISTNPIVIGNLPPTGETKGMQKVAFMGQAPVLVAGPVASGDYLLPSGNHDGFAIAVGPDKMKMGDYTRIVGVAWETGDPDFMVQYINAGIGINNDIVLEKMGVIDAKWTYVQQLLMNDNAGSLSNIIPAFEERTTRMPQLSMAEFDALMDFYREPIEMVFSYAQQQWADRGIDFSGIGQLALFYHDPIAFLKQIREDPVYATTWAIFDRHFNTSDND